MSVVRKRIHYIYTTEEEGVMYILSHVENGMGVKILVTSSVHRLRMAHSGGTHVKLKSGEAA